jgi:hypothetical protein
MLAQEHHQAVAVVRSRAQAHTGTVLVAVSVMSDPPAGRHRRPAWVSTIEARQQTTWIIRTPTPAVSPFDRATLILIDSLRLCAGESGHAEGEVHVTLSRPEV